MKHTPTALQKTRLALMVAAVSTAGLHSAPLLAQNEQLQLEEVLVTARKRSESLQDVPMAVTAIGQDLIEERTLQSIDDVARYAPGLSFSKAFGRATERPVIRGLGNVLAGVQFGVESGAAYFVDGVYYAGDIQGLNLNDLERVEVIKGPQSALYGRNTYSGAINFVTRSPGEEFEGEIKAIFAEDGEMDVRALFSGPLTDTLGGSLSLRTYDYDGEWENEVTQKDIGDESTDSIAGMLEWTPSDSLRIRGRLSYQEDDDGTRPFFLQTSESNNCSPGYRSLAYWPAAGSSNDNQYYCGDVKPGNVALNDGDDADGVANVIPGVPTELDPFSLIFPPFLLPTDPYDLTDGTAFDGVERDLYLASFLMDYQFDSGYAITFSSAYRDEELKTGSDSDHSPVNYKSPIFDSLGDGEGFFALSSGSETDDWSVELRLDSPQDQRFRWMLGGFYFEQDKDAYDITFTLGDLADSKEDVDNIAAFGSATFDFTETVALTVEARYMEETKELDDLDTATGETTFYAEDTWHSFTPRVTLNWDVNDDTMVYATYSEGAKPGGFNGSDGAEVNEPTYEQEESTNYELGIKSTFWDGRLMTNAAVFFTEVTDIQLTTPITNPSGALNSIATNQGEGEVFGVEIDVTALLTENLTVGFNYALADTEFTEGCDDFEWALTSGGGKFDGNEATSPDFTGNGTCDIEGNQFPLSSKHQAAAYGDYRRPIGDGRMEFFAGADVTYEDKKPVQVHNRAYAPSSTLVGARVGLSGDNWQVAVFGKNLTDEDATPMVTRWLQIPYLVAQPVFGTASNTAPWFAGADTGFPRAFFGALRRGRQYGVELSYNF